VSLEKGIVFSIKVKKDELSRLRFLATIKGFSNESYTDDLPAYRDYVMYTAIYNVHFSFRQERSLKKSIKNGGDVTNVLHLGREPLLSKEDRTMLIDCLLITTVAFSSGLICV
jgi:hypothetical protein